MNKKQKVYVGLSGGVDSAVSAAILKDQGYDVVACFIKTWAPEGYPCPTETDRRESMRVAAHLAIPWIEVDGEEVYKNNVASYMLKEYAAGRTPNPDVFCNKAVKFGTFYDLAIKNGADFVATGHYAQMIDGKMFKGIDKSKDQTYFLWNVPIEKLQKTLFPIGNIPKTKVRELAKKYKLPNAERPDSQGVCFLGPIDMKAYLKEVLKPTAGEVLNTKGEIIGKHDGVVLYTIGERHGFEIFKNHDKPLFILEKNIDRNTITVGEDFENKKFNKSLIISDPNYLGYKPESDEIIDAAFRYHGELHKIKINESNEIIFMDEKVHVAEGQSVVFYKNNQCLGGAIINYK